MLHISPPECAEALFSVCHQAVKPGGFLMTYGPYRVDGFLSESNQAFEANYLKGMDERFFIKELRELEQLAAKHSFTLESKHDMPSNNLTLIWRHSAAA